MPDRAGAGAGDFPQCFHLHWGHADILSNSQKAPALNQPMTIGTLVPHRSSSCCLRRLCTEGHAAPAPF